MKSLSSDYGELPQLQTGKGKTNGKHKADTGKGEGKVVVAMLERRDQERILSTVTNKIPKRGRKTS